MSREADRPMTTLAVRGRNPRRSVGKLALGSQTTEPRRGNRSSVVAMVGVIMSSVDADVLVAALIPKAAAE